MKTIRTTLGFVGGMLRETWVLLSLVTVIGGAAVYGHYWPKYIELYDEANNPDNSREAVEMAALEEGLTFTQIGEHLYTLTGPVGQGDCERIVPDMPTDSPFTVILESPGGSLADGSCLAAHFKLRDVTTVVRATPIIDEFGQEIYTPGASQGDSANGTPLEGRVICASACGLMFLGGDERYLIGDVMFGIHGPGTPPQYLRGQAPQTIESSAFRTAAGLLDLLKHLGVEDDDLRMLFIRVPNSTMYWLNPRDFEALPALETLATHYKNFFGLTKSTTKAGTS